VTVRCLQPNPVRFEHFGSDPKTAIETYTFDWHTEAACTPPPAPPCDSCTCAGVDLSSLRESFQATGLSYIDQEGNLCDPAETPAPPLLPAAVVPVEPAALRNGDGAEPCTGYTNLTDPWRAAAGPSGNHSDATLPPGFYRFVGGGDAIPNFDPSASGHAGHCGAGHAGWLSGCDGTNDTAGWSCSLNGTYPLEGTVNGTVCFHSSDAGTGAPFPCRYAVNVKVTSCFGVVSDFLVWELPPAPVFVPF
jgi:hypothetical protein